METQVVIDPGHGGAIAAGRSSPFGVRGPGGLLEKDVTLRLARLVARRLGGHAALTRTDDENPSLGTRTAVARQVAAPVFLSIHANGGPKGARGTETYVHPQAGPGSRALARAVHGAVTGLGGADGGLCEGALAVLAPDRLGARTAACLVEVDYLTDEQGARRLRSPDALDRIASALADGIQAYLRTDRSWGGAQAARALDDYFTDTGELDTYLRDERGADSRMVSSVADALPVITAFRGSTAASPWTSLDRAQVADRIQQLVEEPRRFAQGALNLCGPAAMLHVWTGRDPVGFARFATELFDTGTGRIGSLEVTPGRDLVTREYGAMLPLMGGNVAPQADWMTLGAVRNSSDIFLPWTGHPLEEAPGLTRPEEVASWLTATRAFGSVSNEANWVFLKGLPHASGLLVAEGIDNVLLVNTNMFRSATMEVIWPAPTAGQEALRNLRAWILDQFPNHFIVLRSDIVQDRSTGDVQFSAWTWGTVYRLSVPQQDFIDNYYGAVIARL